MSYGRAMGWLAERDPDGVAVVFGDDGQSVFPSTVTSGGTVTDSSGRTYDFGPGRYRFPFVVPGSYRLEVEGPRTYIWPTRRSDTELAAVPAIVVTGHAGPDLVEAIKSLQAEFFASFVVSGTKTHVLQNGDTIWILARDKFEVPVWLLRQYNPDLDFGALQAGATMVVPLIERRPS